MKLQRVFGNTYFIKGGTNTGVYLFENKNALLIDPGLSGLRPKNMINMFENEKIIPKYIVNTHEHEDHVGACHQIKNAYPEIAIFASDEAKLFIERPELFSDFILGGKHNKFLTEKLFHRNTEKIYVDEIICEGKLQKNGVDFEVINLKGHTSGSIGILTSDGVLFAGDLLIGEETLSKYDFLFLQDVEEYLKSLDIVKSLDFDYIVLAHGKKVLDKNDTILLIEKHKQAVHKYLCQIIENLKVPMNVDTLLKKIIKENELTYNYKEYYFQAVSNSSWAHEGYLVAPKIDMDIIPDLERLGNAFGIGIIKLDVIRPQESELLVPARTRSIIDSDTLDMLVEKNDDFKIFVDRVLKNKKTNEVTETNYDKILSDEDLSRYITEHNKIFQEKGLINKDYF